MNWLSGSGRGRTKYDRQRPSNAYHQNSAYNGSIRQPTHSHSVISSPTHQDHVEFQVCKGFQQPLSEKMSTNPSYAADTSINAAYNGYTDDNSTPTTNSSMLHLDKYIPKRQPTAHQADDVLTKKQRLLEQSDWCALSFPTFKPVEVPVLKVKVLCMQILMNCIVLQNAESTRRAAHARTALAESKYTV